MNRKWKVIVQFILIALIVAGCSTSGNDSGTYQVTDIVDGDTIKVQFDDHEETVRLLLVDTPETVHPEKPVQPFGKEASSWMKDHLTDERVKLEIGISERDKYGRILAYVYDGNGQMVNELLLEKGLARVAYIYPPNTKYVDEFRKIQRVAQQKRLGIWSLENYVTEDGFTPTETENENQPDSDCRIKGNINSDGEKIYHLQNGAYYDVTIAEKMFCTEAQAQHAGFRPSKR